MVETVTNDSYALSFTSALLGAFGILCAGLFLRNGLNNMIFLFVFLLGLLAVILGIIALVQKKEFLKAKKWLAITGILFGFLVFFMITIGAYLV